MTDPLGQSQVLAYLKGLSKGGNVRFVLISYEKAESYKKLKDVIEAVCKDAGIIWHPLTYTPKPPVLSTFKDVQKMKALAVKLHKQYPFSLIHCRSYIPALVGLFMKRRYKVPFLFDMRGFWADERIDGGIWKLSNPLFKIIYNFFKRKEKAFLNEADQVISLTNNAKGEILSWPVKSIAPITVIPCCVDLDLFDPEKLKEEDKMKALHQLKIPPKSNIIMYVGSLGTWYMLDEMVAFVKVYHQLFPESYFVILTREPEEMVIKAANKVGLDSKYIRVLPVARQEMPLYVSLATVSLFFIKPSYSKKASSPVKQGELMAMGIPIICNDSVGDTAEIIEKSKAGIVLKAFNNDAYADAITAFQNMTIDKNNIKRNAEATFSLERGIKTYSETYNKIFNEQL